MNRKKNTLMIETVMEDLVQEYQQELSLSQAISLPDEAADADPLSPEKELISLAQEEINLPKIDASVETCIPFLDQDQNPEKKQASNNYTEVLNLMEFKPNESGLTSEKEEKLENKPKKKQKKSPASSTPTPDLSATQLDLNTLSDTASIIEMPLKKKEVAEMSPASASFPIDGNIALATHSYQENQASQIPVQLSLQQSENLRLAQERITSLEEEVQRLRQENEELITTSDIFKERLDKILAKNDDLKKAHQENREDFITEKRTLMDTLSEQSREIDKMQVKNKELEKRLSNNLQHIRVRERELENRLELVKVDSQTLVREKNRYILQLKQQMERSKMDLDTHKSKYSELKQTLEEHLEQSRRAVRGIQMVMHILKGHSVSRDETEPIEQIKPTEQNQESTNEPEDHDN